jgi:putative ABC transport system permease protein
MRAKEVGIRKVLGVNKGRLIFQFLGESLMVLFFSILLSIGICELLNPLFNSYFGLDVQLNWFDQNVLLFFAVLALTIVLTSGVYPAALISSFMPVAVLKGGKLNAGKNVGLRKGLVISQFAISIFLIIASLLISAQTEFLNSKDLGFNKEATVLVDLNNSKVRSERETLKNALLENSNIRSVTGLSGEPGGFHDVTVFQAEGVDGNHRMRTVFTDLDYLNVFDIELNHGRNFSKEIATDAAGAMIINESGLAELGISAEEAMGKRVVLPSYGNAERTIIGVVKDYHFNSLRDEIEPLAIIATTSNRSRRMAIKINPENINETLLYIDESYTKISPEFPMSYDFIDESLERLYENERKQGRVFTAFSGISIFLACLGIYGLAAYSAQQRQKELGIRKVLGATARQIIGLISTQFVVLVLIAAFVAAPAVWYFMDQWLGGFAYRISLMENWYVFLLAGFVAILIAIFTVAFKTYRAAVSDPTESIRNE